MSSGNETEIIEVPLEEEESEITLPSVYVPERADVARGIKKNAKEIKARHAKEAKPKRKMTSEQRVTALRNLEKARMTRTLLKAERERERDVNEYEFRGELPENSYRDEISDEEEVKKPKSRQKRLGLTPAEQRIMAMDLKLAQLTDYMRKLEKRNEDKARAPRTSVVQVQLPPVQRAEPRELKKAGRPRKFRPEDMDEKNSLEEDAKRVLSFF